MYLVDTSVWIDYFNDTRTSSSQFLRKILISKLTIGINNPIYMEVLQGISNDKARNNIKENLNLHAFYSFMQNQQSYENAAMIYSSCRKKGITIRSSIDCLIAQCAIEHDVILLHNDKDFVRMATVISTLQQQYTGD